MSSRQPKRAKSKTREVIAIVADVVRSRTSADRIGLQKVLVELAEELNREHGTALVAKFEISQGDSMEALLELDQYCLASILSYFITRPVTMRVSVSRGEVFEPVSQSPALTDGPAWWAARERLAESKNKYAHGPMFTGFGDEMDKVLTGIGQSLSQQVHSWTENQRRVVGAKWEHKQSSLVAKQLGISEAQVSRTLKAVNYHSYVDLGIAFGSALKLALQKQP